jgi:hypothetical protein
MQTQLNWFVDSMAGQQPRGSERSSVEAEISLRTPGKLQYRVRLFDVSPLGCKAEFVERPRVDDQVWITFAGIEAIEAKVCWVAGFKGGLKFVRPIHPAVFDALMGRLRLRAKS